MERFTKKIYVYVKSQFQILIKHHVWPPSPVLYHMTRWTWPEALSLPLWPLSRYTRHVLCLKVSHQSFNFPSFSPLSLLPIWASPKYAQAGGPNVPFCASEVFSLPNRGRLIDCCADSVFSNYFQDSWYNRHKTSEEKNEFHLCQAATFRISSCRF